MKRTAKTLLLLLLCALFALSAFGCDRLVGKQNREAEETSEDPRYVVQEGAGMSEYEVYNFFDMYQYPLCIAMEYYGGSGMSYNESGTITEEDGSHWAPTNVPLYPDLASLESYVASFFGGSFLSNLRTTAGLEGDDYDLRYKDIDGKLYIRTDKLNDSVLFSLDPSTIEIVANTTEQVKVTIDGKLDETLYECRVILDKIDGGWRVTYFVPNTKEVSTLSENVESAS